VVPYALARVCLGWGVRPTALVGWGGSRLVAGCLAGVFSVAQALAVATGRGGELDCVEPRLPVSLGTGWLQPWQAVDPETWRASASARYDRQAVSGLLKEAGLVAVELDASGARSATQVLLDAAGLAWTHGAEVDWSAWYPAERRRRVPLPTYPYERRRHWLAPPDRSAGASRSDQDEQADQGEKSDLRRRVEGADGAERRVILQEFLSRHIAGLLDPDGGQLPDPDENLYLLGADSLILIDAIASLGTVLDRSLPSSIEDPPTIRKLADQVAGAWRQG
jgi:acyl transferase domain-containing protein